MKAFVRVNDLVPGQVVGERIYDTSRDYLLLSEGVALDEKMIWRLKERRVSAIQVTDAFITPEEVALENSKAETVERLSSFVDDFYHHGTTSLEMLNQALDEIISQLAADNTIMVYLHRISEHANHVLEHSVDVAIYAALIGLGCGLSRDDITLLGMGALLHDIGKLGVDRQLLNKPSVLSENEFALIKKHPEFGYQQLKRIESLDERARRVSLEHHERLDGLGYPNGLRGDRIHFYSRIVAICDVYDALTMERAYKKAYRPDQAAQMLKAASNLDKNLIEILLSRLVIYPVGTKVRLSNGAIGVVIKTQMPHNPNPLVKLLLSQYNEYFIRKRMLEVVEIGKGIDIAGVVSNAEYQQLLDTKTLG